MSSNKTYSSVQDRKKVATKAYNSTHMENISTYTKIILHKTYLTLENI